jgi:hypothetical protein
MREKSVTEPSNKRVIHFHTCFVNGYIMSFNSKSLSISQDTYCCQPMQENYNETHNPNYMETSIIDFFEVLLLWHFEHLKLETCPNYDEQTMGKTLISIYVNVQI